jgi:ribulose-phosphate 3-epimerase
MILAPSLLAANFMNLSKDCQTLKDHGIQWLHYDVMDGYFVPNHSFGVDILKQIKQNFDFVYDVHLMVSNPRLFIEYFSKVADVLTIHIEACKDVQEAIELINIIHNHGIKAGICIKPNTSVFAIEPLLNLVDLVLVMSVEPGFGGQCFMVEMLEKVKLLKEFKNKNDYHYMIQIDGGINKETGEQARLAGVENLVVGSYLFKDLTSRISEFQ